MAAVTLTSCSVVTSHTADPMMLLDFSHAAEVRHGTPELKLSVYKQVLSQSYELKDVLVPTEGLADFNQFRDQLISLVSCIQSSLQATAPPIASRANCSFYGKGSFQPGSESPQLATKLRFRYRWGVPSDSSKPYPWQQDWMKAASGDFPELLELPAGDIPKMALTHGEPRLCGAFLQAVISKKKRQPQPLYYRACFCCIGSTAVGSAFRLLCWLHPERDPPVLDADARVLERAAFNNYLCVLERAGAAASWDRPALLFLALEAGSWAAADWLMSGPRGCGVDAVDRWGDTALTWCCGRGGNPAEIAFLFDRGASRQRRDADGNSAMHRLVSACRSAVDAAEVRGALDALAGDLSPRQLATWLGEVNLAGEKAAAVASSPGAVRWLLERLLGEPCGQERPVDVSEALNLLRCDNGFSLAHTAAAFDRLKAIGDVVTLKLGASAWQQLLSAADVKSGPLRGYSPMHAACQEGAWSSISYLMQRGCPAPAADAIDLAIREGRLSECRDFFNFAKYAFKDASDASLAALRTIDQAADCLTRPVSGTPFAGTAGCFVHAVEFRLHRATFRSAVSHNDPLALRALDEAFKKNSAASLRALARDRERPGSLLVECEDPAILRSLSVATMTEDIPFGLLGVALFNEKWQLAGDLLPTRQLDLLPACLCVMLTVRRRIRVRPVEAKKAEVTSGGERQPIEMMHDLYRQAKRTFCDALERLHLGVATAEQKTLVLNYLGGRFHLPGSSATGKGEFGPLFAETIASAGSAERCVFDLVMLTGEPDLLALQAVTKYVDRLMSSPMTFCCHRCPGQRGNRQDGPACSVVRRPLDMMADWWPQEAAWLRRRLPRGFTPMLSMAITVFFNLLVIGMLGYFTHLVGARNAERQRMTLRLILLLCGVSYATQELQDMCLTTRDQRGLQLRRRITRYVAFKWNLLDIAAVALLLTGLVWDIVLDPTGTGSDNVLGLYYARLLLAISFALYCLRMLSSLEYFEHLGLYISITKTVILMDVVPFLIVNAFFLVAFGFLIVCLLYPGRAVYPAGQSYADAKPKSEPLPSDVYIAEIFQRPLFAHFGEFGMDGLRACRQKPGKEDDSASCPHPLGNDLYTRLVLFVYLLIVSVVLINVLIAKLSLTVSREDGRARVIWRRFRAQLLKEFSGSSAPPLLRACVGLVGLLYSVCRRVIATSSRPQQDGAAAIRGEAISLGAKKTAADSNVTRSGEPRTSTDEEAQQQQQKCDAGADAWWRSSDLRLAPEDYVRFLWLQAMQFRTVRHTFGHHHHNQV